MGSSLAKYHVDNITPSKNRSSEIDRIIIYGGNNNYGYDVMARLLYHNGYSAHYIIDCDSNCASSVCECSIAAIPLFAKNQTDKSIGICVALPDKMFSTISVDNMDMLISLVADLARSHGKKLVYNSPRTTTKSGFNIIFTQMEYSGKELTEFLGECNKLLFAGQQASAGALEDVPQSATLSHTMPQLATPSHPSPLSSPLVGEGQGGGSERPGEGGSLESSASRKTFYNVFVCVPPHRSYVNFKRVCRQFNYHDGILLNSEWLVGQFENLEKAMECISRFNSAGYRGRLEKCLL